MDVSVDQYELVEGASDKFYRLYTVSGVRRGARAGLIRQWGRRGAAGQWLIERGDSSSIWDRWDNLVFSKEQRGYAEVVRDVTFPVPSATRRTVDEFDGSKTVRERVREELVSGFTQAWLDRFDEKHWVDPRHDARANTLIVVYDWEVTAKARAPAGVLHDRYVDNVLWRNSNGLAVVRIPFEAVDAFGAVYCRPGDQSLPIASAEEHDSHDMIATAVRLYKPHSRGPYRRFADAVVDARKLHQ